MNENQITKGQIFEKPKANAVGAHDCARINNNKLTANVVGGAASYACDICNSRRSNSYPNSDPHSRGITLIALIITIIIMLILVAVTITIAIKGNLFGTTKSGAKQMTIEAYKENLEAIRVNAMMEQIKNGLTSDQFLDKVKEGIETSKVFEERQDLKKTRSSVKVTTKEGYLFKITENEVTYLGLANEQGEITINLSKDNTDFIYKPDGWSRGPVKVSIEPKVDADELGAVLEYSINGGEWQEYDYTKQITIEDEGAKIQARLYSEEEDEYGDEVEETVTDKIDRLNPNPITNFAGTGTEYTITLTGSTEDMGATSIDGSSGIKAYYYSIDDGETWLPNGGTPDTSYTFENLEDSTTYDKLKMKAVDGAGNETVTNAITVTTKKVPKPEIGDYINYEPDPVTTEYTLSGEYSGYGVTASKPEGTDQIIPQDKLDWQILKVDKDGIDIIGTPTKKIVYFGGSLGYNNGVYLMHDMCETLYSKKSKGITARSVNLEDFESAMTETAKATRDAFTSYEVQYGHPYTYSGSNTYYPNIYALENGSGINTTTVKTDGINASGKGYSSPTKETYSPETTTSDSKLTVTHTAYSMPINNTNYGQLAIVLKNSRDFWLASRAVWHYSGYGYFELRYGGTSFDSYSGDMFRSDGVDQGPFSHYLRPVVHLGTGVRLQLTEEGTNSKTNPHQIINY